jgi:hypothetical protein
MFYPAAQLPLAVPPLLEHSLDVKHVPFRTELFGMKQYKKHFHISFIKNIVRYYGILYFRSFQPLFTCDTLRPKKNSAPLTIIY